MGVKMTGIVRGVGAIAAGLAAAFVLIVGVEFYSAIVHPLPPGFGETMEEMCRHVANYPAWVLATVVPLWALTALAGTWIAGRIGNRACAVIVGLVLIAALAFNLSMLPYPLWFKIAELVTVPVAALLGVGSYLLRAKN